jgi:hypothetical protein
MALTTRVANALWAAAHVVLLLAAFACRLLVSVVAGWLFIFLFIPRLMLEMAAHFLWRTTSCAPLPSAPPPTEPTTHSAEDDDSAASRVAALPEMWFVVAEHSGLVGAWQLTGVCRASREGAKEWLRSLPRLVVVYEGAMTATRASNYVWRLDLASLQWESMPALVTARIAHACCAVRGSVAVIGGLIVVGNEVTTVASVEVLPSREGAACVSLPPLSCGGIRGAAAIAVERSDSTAGQVLILGGVSPQHSYLSTVQLVDLATGTCTPQLHLLHTRAYPAVARLLDGRVVCAGGIGGGLSVEIWGPPEQGARDAAWTWTEMPAMSTARHNCGGCVMSDGRFAVLGGSRGTRDEPMSSCEALTIGDINWEPLPPMHDARTRFACAAMAGCIVVAGGKGCQSAELYDEVLGRWLRLPRDLPYVSSMGMSGMSGALL